MPQSHSRDSNTGTHTTTSPERCEDGMSGERRVTVLSGGDDGRRTTVTGCSNVIPTDASSAVRSERIQNGAPADSNVLRGDYSLNGGGSVSTAVIRQTRMRSLGVRTSPYPSEPPSLAVSPACVDGRMDSSIDRSHTGTRISSSYFSPLYHLASRMSRDDLCCMLLLQRKLQQQHISVGSSQPRVLCQQQQIQGPSLPSPSSGHRIGDGEVKRLRIVAPRSRGVNAPGRPVGSLWRQAMATVDDPSTTLRNRKRKRTTARLDRRYVLRCINCDRLDKGGCTFGDYFLCNYCGSNDFTVVADVSPDRRGALGSSDDEF